ncbi:hypothetical protein Dsin_012901 [Dipteronia sinensis]|uniref:Uncharacterized protein n=1 Tax=Dipteronia sinensis TaxID=43782 RepID=A0AAE0E8G9_9ROSI|nr:hypothetical protein Dsin_012901 [Dipteronia sinensis]
MATKDATTLNLVRFLSDEAPKANCGDELNVSNMRANNNMRDSMHWLQYPGRSCPGSLLRRP